MDYQQAVFTSPTWGARRTSTGEFIEFSSQTDKWVYTWPRYGVQFDYDRLADWAEDMPDTAKGDDWRSLLPKGRQLQEMNVCVAYPKNLDP